MLVGLVPVGGNASRLNIPFSKSMVPQKGFDYYNPVINHCVQNLVNTGVDKIVFGHGATYKQDILAYYQDTLFQHVIEEKGPSDGGNRFVNNILNIVEAEDYIFCLPDTVSTTTNYKDLLIKNNVVCGMYTIPDEVKGDRPLPNGKFDVKTFKTNINANTSWGTIKINKEVLEKNKIQSHIGEWLNGIKIEKVNLGKMVDIGTWTGYNYYLNNF